MKNPGGILPSPQRLYALQITSAVESNHDGTSEQESRTRAAYVGRRECRGLSAWLPSARAYKIMHFDEVPLHNFGPSRPHMGQVHLGLLQPLLLLLWAHLHSHFFHVDQRVKNVVFVCQMNAQCLNLPILGCQNHLLHKQRRRKERGK
jgi:hypothetical protein